jgi:hypothetical protein
VFQSLNVGVLLRQGFAGLLAAAAAAGIVTYPLLPGPLAAGLAIYAALLWRWPQAWLVLLPMLLPVVDLAPWSGRFYFDEGDFLVLVTAAVLYARLPLFKSPLLPGRVAGAVVALLAVAQLVAMLRGLLPLAPIGDNAFNTYFSPYNALRVAKGLGWALLLLPPLSYALARDRQEALWQLCAGYLLGLSAVVAFALRERQVFTGLFDFDLPFRVTSTFSSMHLGGGAIAAFLSLILPLLALPFVMPAGMLRRLTALGLLAAAGYVLLVTFSRAAYLGTLVGFLILLVSLPMAAGRRRAARLGRAVGLILLAGVVALLIGIGLPGTYAAARFDLLTRDLDNRLWEWREGLTLADDGAMASVFGTGLGSYPRAFLERNTDARVPTTFEIEREGEQEFLRLGSGENLYVGQRVALRPFTTYRLSLRFRAASPDGRIVVPICEKTLLYSVNCGFASFTPDAAGEWEAYSTEFDSEWMGRPAGLLGLLRGRPVELALLNPVDGTVLDVDDVSLVATDGAAAGSELLVNGDFSANTDRWFFAADDLATWRIENMWLMTLFEQGVLGVVALALVVMVTLVGLLRRITGGPAAEAGPAAVLLASLGGFLTVGLAHGLVDAPRPMTMFYLLLFAALCIGRPIAGAPRLAALQPGPGLPGT